MKRSAIPGQPANTAMTPFTALYRKERRRHVPMLLVTLAVMGATAMLPNRYFFTTKELFSLLIALLYMLGLVSVSYSGERNQRIVEIFPGEKPDGAVVWRAKLSWIMTTILVFFTFFFLIDMFLPISAAAYALDRNSNLTLFADAVSYNASFLCLSLCSGIAWATFWTTRTRSPVVAFALSLASGALLAFFCWKPFELLFGQVAFRSEALFGSYVIAILGLSGMIALLGRRNAVRYFETQRQQTTA